MKVIRVFDVFIVKRRKRGRFGEKEKEGLKNEGICVLFLSLRDCFWEMGLKEMEWGLEEREREGEMGFNGWANLGE